MKKLGLAAICKDEAPYILEWIAHHRLQGIHEIYIADNGSTDGTWDMLDALRKAGVVHLMAYRTRSDEKPQLSAYRELLARYREEVEWLAFIDCDEFITPTRPSMTLATMIASLGADQSVGGIALNWATYGSSGHQQYAMPPVTERFLHHADASHGVNRHFKTLAKSSAILDFDSPHCLALKDGMRYVHTNGQPIERTIESTQYGVGRTGQVCWEDFRVNHYVIKSWAEFNNRKRPRGRAYTPDEWLTTAFFLAHDNNHVFAPVDAGHLKRLRDEVRCLVDALDRHGVDIQPFIERAKQSINGPALSAPIVGMLESIERVDECVRFQGWGLAWHDQALERIELIVNGQPIVVQEHRTTQRPDVQTHYPLAPADTGFMTTVNAPNWPSEINSIEVIGITRESHRNLLPVDPMIANTLTADR